MAQQFLHIRPFADPGISHADTVCICSAFITCLEAGTVYRPNGPIALTKAKYNLISMLPFIPPTYHDRYKDLNLNDKQ